MKNVKIAVGGKSALLYLPVVLAERLGNFKAQGMDVELIDTAGGSKTLQALIGGSADVGSGAYEHTIEIQAKGQFLRAFVVQCRYPVYALGISKAKIASYKSIRDLKGMTVGVTAPGSGTDKFVKFLMQREGLQPSDISVIGVGSSATALAAMRSGKIDAISTLDPATTELEASGDIKIVVDARNAAGSQQVYGGALPSSVLYTTDEFVEKHPATVQALTNAMVKTLTWMRTASMEQIEAAIPPEFLKADKATYLAAFRKVREGYSPDGLFPPGSAENNYKMLVATDDALKAANIDVNRTWTNKFVEASARGSAQ